MYSLSTRHPTRTPTSIYRPTVNPSQSPIAHYDLQVGANVFGYTGYDIGVTIPQGKYRVAVYLWGAGGCNCGGAGAYVEGELDVTPVM